MKFKIDKIDFNWLDLTCIFGLIPQKLFNSLTKFTRISFLLKNSRSGILMVFPLLVILLSCSCPLTEDKTMPPCAVREVTITQFNPDVVQDTVPVPEYSIHTFQFPFDNSSSGSLPNDERFKNKSQIIISQLPFPDGRPYYVAILNKFPQNNDMVGDIMVTNVDSANLLFADLRFYGSLSRIPGSFLSENATEFCDFVRALGMSVIDNAAATATKYGAGLPNSLQKDYSASDVYVVNQAGNRVDTIPVIPALRDTLLARTRGNAIDLRVRLGELYYYKARNSKAFVILITNFSRGTFTPNKRHVSIMFYPL